MLVVKAFCVRVDARWQRAARSTD